MGDGQHVWAAAEWVLILRNCFVREEADKLILGSGLPADWLRRHETIGLGPTPTSWGPISVSLEPARNETIVRWQAEWRGQPPRMEVRLAGHRPGSCCGEPSSTDKQGEFIVPREEAVSEEVRR